MENDNVHGLPPQTTRNQDALYVGWSMAKPQLGTIMNALDNLLQAEAQARRAELHFDPHSLETDADYYAIGAIVRDLSRIRSNLNQVGEGISTILERRGLHIDPEWRI